MFVDFKQEKEMVGVMNQLSIGRDFIPYVAGSLLTSYPYYKAIPGDSPSRTHYPYCVVPQLYRCSCIGEMREQEVKSSASLA